MSLLFTETKDDRRCHVLFAFLYQNFPDSPVKLIDLQLPPAWCVCVRAICMTLSSVLILQLIVIEILSLGVCMCALKHSDTYRWSQLSYNIITESNMQFVILCMHADTITVIRKFFIVKKIFILRKTTKIFYMKIVY